MSSEKQWRLCGGTFFTLISHSRAKMPSKAECYGGVKSGITEAQTLLGLTRVLRPDMAGPKDFDENRYKGNAREFKSCRNFGGGFFQLDDASVLKSFDNRIKNEYNDPLVLMAAFVENFLDVRSSSHKDEYLIKALLEVLDADKYIDDGAKIYAQEDGVPKTKKELLMSEEICVEPFLLGMWHYVLCSGIDNKVGQDTYSEWCPALGESKGSRRDYIANIGETSSRRVQIKYCHPKPKQNIDEQPEMEAEKGPESKKAAETAAEDIYEEDSFDETLQAEVIDEDKKQKDNGKVINQTVNNWYNAPGGIQIEKLGTLVLPQGWGEKNGT